MLRRLENCGPASRVGSASIIATRSESLKLRVDLDGK
jgi:hypothetical protein